MNNAREEGSTTFRAMLTKTPGYVATTTSSQFRTIQPDDINVRDSNILDKGVLLPDSKSKLAADAGSGPLQAATCVRNLRPSQRNKVIMTRSVDHQD